MTKRHLLLYLVFLPTFFRLDAQTYNFKNYGIGDNLPQAYIYSISQSAKGKLWIGTGEGCSSFDGKKFTTYTVNEGLAENFVTTSFQDSDNNIWFGHYEGGITFFDGNRFIKINLKPYVTGPVNAICQDASKNILIGTQKDGILCITSDKKIINFKNTLTAGSVNSLATMPPNKVFAATNSGLFEYSFNNKTLTLIRQLLPDTAIQAIVKKSKGSDFWIGTKEEGLFEFNTGENVISLAQMEEPLLGKNINILYEDKEYNLWLGFYGEGLSRYVHSPSGWTKMDEYNTSTGLSNNYVKSFFVDREKNIWIGTFGGGLNQLIDPVFTLYTVNDGLVSDNITSLCRDNNKLWIGSDHSLTRIIFSKFRHNNLENRKTFSQNIPKGKITSICLDWENKLLLGTEEDGIWRFDDSTNTCIRWNYSATNHLQNKIHQIKRDKKNAVWIATEDGAFKYDHANRKSEHFNMESGLLHNNIYGLFIDSKNNTWFATHGTGMSSYQKGTIKNFSSPQESSGIDINCFEETPSGDLWIGTYGQGVYVFNGNNFIRRFVVKDGLESNYCYAMIRDSSNHIWIGHKNGVSKYNLNKRSFSFYQKKDGFLAEEINVGALSSDDDENIWFGTSNGLLKYNLHADKPVSVGPLIHISDIRLFFQEVDWSKYSDSLFSLSRLPLHMVLPYEKNHLTFSVNGISLSNPDKVRYKYKLVGFEKDWSLETNENFVTYANMQPGKYSFIAIAKNAEGIWSKTPATINFEILNPFWKTWWFIILSFVFVIFLIVLTVKIRTTALEKRQKQLQEEKLKLLAEIKERKKAERMQKISEEKLRQTNQELNTFIYRASHDLRGPLSTVKGLTNLGIMEIKDEGSLRYFHLISDRIMRLDMILKDLIHIVEITEIDLEFEEIEMHACVDEIVTTLTESLQKNVAITKDITAKNLFVSDKKLFNIVLSNIIDNSIKYTNPDNKISTVSIVISDYINGIRVVITDNGIGIPKDIKNKIFDMFFRGTDQSKGSGLGLYIVNKIINKLEGSIKVDSTYMQSTRIEIYLPSMVYLQNK